MARFAPAGWAVMLAALLMEMAALRYGSQWAEAGCGLIWGALLTDFIACALLRRKPLVREVRQDANHAGEALSGYIGTLPTRRGVTVAAECEGALVYGTLPDDGGRIQFIGAARARGVHAWPAIVLRCNGPLALCFVNVTLQPNGHIVTWPARWPEAQVPRPRGAGQPDARRVAEEADWLRDWRPEDGLRRIAQKASARAGKWVATPPTPERERVAITLAWARQRCGGVERALSLMGRIIEDANARGEWVRINLHGSAWIDGPAERQMLALAQYREGEANG